MTTTDKIPILGSKAVIFKNKYDVWQFRMYVKNARRYVEKSLRTKERALAEVNRPQFAGGSKVSMDGAYGKK